VAVLETNTATAAQGALADTAHGWGDHSTNGYLTAYTESDPIWTGVSNLYASLTYLESAIAAATGALDSVAFTGELDPVWGTVSNTVTPGAAAGATAVQPTDAAYTNTAALAAGAVQDETDPTTTNLLDLAGTRAMTGDSVTLARDVKSRDATSVAATTGAAFGYQTD
jgi:hypothetical protein